MHTRRGVLIEGVNRPSGDAEACDNQIGVELSISISLSTVSTEQSAGVRSLIPSVEHTDPRVVDSRVFDDAVKAAVRLSRGRLPVDRPINTSIDTVVTVDSVDGTAVVDPGRSLAARDPDSTDTPLRSTDVGGIIERGGRIITKRDGVQVPSRCWRPVKE
jgi:hypothetical protein